jgi:hypothetical protein
MIGWNGFFGRGDEAEGVWRKVDISHYDVCNHCLVFDFSEWLALRTHYSDLGYPTRRSNFTLSCLNLC